MYRMYIHKHTKKEREEGGGRRREKGGKREELLSLFMKITLLRTAYL